MFDRPPAEGGTQGQPFTTETTEYTIKVNQQFGGASTLTFMTQLGTKYQPYRFGSGVSAPLYPVESTAIQDSRSHIGKAGYLHVIGNRATLTGRSNVRQHSRAARTDKTRLVCASPEGPTHAGVEDRRRHSDADSTLYADRHDIKIATLSALSPRFTAYGAPGPARTAGHFYIATTNGVPTSFWTDNGPVWSANSLKNHALFFQDRFQVTSKLTLNYGVRFDQYHSSYPEQRFGLNGNQPCIDETDCDVGPFAVRAVTPARTS